MQLKEKEEAEEEHEIPEQTDQEENPSNKTPPSKEEKDTGTETTNFILRKKILDAEMKDRN